MLNFSNLDFTTFFHVFVAGTTSWNQEKSKLFYFLFLQYLKNTEVFGFVREWFKCRNVSLPSKIIGAKSLGLTGNN